MNIPTNRTRLFEILAGLLATQLIVFELGFYMLNEPTRIAESQTQILHIQLDDAMTLYAQNCSVCHGLAGEGIGAIPPLNNPALQTMAYDDLTKNHRARTLQHCHARLEQGRRRGAQRLSNF